jgi:hypothetical protein
VACHAVGRGGRDDSRAARAVLRERTVADGRAWRHAAAGGGQGAQLLPHAGAGASVRRSGPSARGRPRGAPQRG